MTPIGRTLTRKTSRHDRVSTKIPPISGPASMATVVAPVQMPIARACAGPRNVEVMRASELGTSRAPATPCTARAAMRNSAVGAAAIATEATPKPTRPMRSTTTRPRTSLRDPATRMNAPSVTRYASTTHCCVESPPPSSRAMAGRATLTTVPSRNDTKDARTAIVSTTRCSRVIGSATCPA